MTRNAPASRLSVLNATWASVYGSWFPTGSNPTKYGFRIPLYSVPDLKTCSYVPIVGMSGGVRPALPVTELRFWKSCFQSETFSSCMRLSRSAVLPYFGWKFWL